MCLTDSLFRLQTYYFLQWRALSARAIALHNAGCSFQTYLDAVTVSVDALARHGRFDDLRFSHRNLLPERAESLQYDRYAHHRYPTLGYDATREEMSDAATA